MRPVWAWLRERYFAADERSLGAFRIGLGLLLCAVLISRWRLIDAFYTDDGLVPSFEVLLRTREHYAVSIYHALSGPFEVHVGFAATLVVFVLFTVGYRTRLMHVLAAVCAIGLSHRSPILQHEGYTVANILLVFSALLPLGRRLSVDAWRGERIGVSLARRGAPVVSLAVFALIAQWVVIYTFNAVSKTGPTWQEGTALHYFLHLDRLVTPIAVWLREVLPASLLWTATKGALAIEYAIPVLLVVPFRQTWARRLSLALALLLHVGIALAVNGLWHYSAAMVLLWVLLLTDADWVVLARWADALSQRATVQRLVTGVADRYARAQSWLGIGGAKRALPDLDAPPSRLDRGCAVAREATAALLMVAIAIQLPAQNAWFLPRARIDPPAFFAAIIDYPRIGQIWDMFAPDVPQDDFRMVVDGRTVDGRKLDPLTGEPPDFRATSTSAGGARDLDWSSYGMNLAEPEGVPLRRYLVRWLRRYHRRSGDPEDELVAFDVWYIRDDSPPPGKTAAQPTVPVKLLSFGKVPDSPIKDYEDAPGSVGETDPE